MNENSSPSDFGSGFSENNLDSVTVGFTDQNICGEGASCIVYRMRLSGLLVAVKRLREEYRTDPSYIASYRKEFQIGQRLKHDALPVYRDFHEDIKNVYIVMDYVDGISIEEFIKTAEGVKYFSSAENVRRFLKELLNVIGYLHRCGVIHCDLKPANIMLRHIDRGVMLLDLDKSYCDVLDTTHGGTFTISDPLGTGQKPTALKDFSAIGKIFDTIKGIVPGFPSSKFKRFRKECQKEDVNIDNLLNTLQSSNHKEMWIGCLILVGLIGLFLLLFNSSHTHQDPYEIEHSVKDTVVLEKIPEQDNLSIEKEFSKQNSISKKGIANDPSSHELSEGAPSSDNTALSATHNKTEEDAPSNKISEGAIPGKNASSTTAENNESIDDEERQWWIDMSTGEGSRKYVPQYLLDIKFNIEDEMKEMIVLAKECEKSLASNLSDEENEKKKSSFDKAFLKSFQKAVTKCQNLYPDIDKYEVEREVTRRLDYSVLSKLYQRYHKAYRDTLSSRQKLRDNLQ